MFVMILLCTLVKRNDMYLILCLIPALLLHRASVFCVWYLCLTCKFTLSALTRIWHFIFGSILSCLSWTLLIVYRWPLYLWPNMFLNDCQRVSHCTCNFCYQWAHCNKLETHFIHWEYQLVTKISEEKVRWILCMFVQAFIE